MSFQLSVHSTPRISECLKTGLGALGRDSNKVLIDSTADLCGSVNIDSCLRELYPNEPRWDYVFGYKTHVFYMEVHPAKTGQVRKVVDKLQWLKGWRKQFAPRLEAAEQSSTYHWIATGKTAIAKKSRYFRILAQHGIIGPSSRLNADKYL